MSLYKKAKLAANTTQTQSTQPTQQHLTSQTFVQLTTQPPLSSQNNGYQLDQNTQRPLLQSHDEINAYLSATTSVGYKMSSDGIHQQNQDLSTPSKITKNAPPPSVTRSTPGIGAGENNNNNSDLTMDDLFGDFDEFEHPPVDFFDRELEYENEINHAPRGEEHEPDEYEPDDIEAYSTTPTTPSRVNNQRDAETKQKEMDSLQKQQEEFTRKKLPLRLASRGVAQQGAELIARQRQFEQEKKEAKLAKKFAKKSKMDKSNANNGALPTPTKSSKSLQPDLSGFDNDMMDIISSQKNSTIKKLKPGFTSSVIFTSDDPLHNRANIISKKKNQNGEDVMVGTGQAKLIEETLSLPTRNAILTPFTAGSSKSTLLKTHYPTLNKTEIIAANRSQNETLPKSLQHRHAEDLLGINKNDVSILDSYAEEEPFKEYLLVGTSFSQSRGWGNMMTIGKPQLDDTTNVSNNKPKSFYSTLKPAYIVVESAKQEQLRLTARRRILDLEQHALMMVNEFDRYLDNKDNFNESSHTFEIEPNTYKRLISNLSIANRRAIVAKLLDKEHQSKQNNIAQTSQQYLNFLTLLQNQHKGNTQHALRLKLGDIDLRQMQLKQQIEMELFFRFLRASGDQLAITFARTQISSNELSGTNVLYDPSNIELIYNNTTVEFIKELLSTTNGKKKSHNSEINTELGRINNDPARQASLRDSLVNAKIPFDKNAEFVEHRLYVDKYAPKHYSQLLSGEKYNKDVLLWLTKYNYLVFKRDVPQMSITQFPTYGQKFHGNNNQNNQNKSDGSNNINHSNSNNNNNNNNKNNYNNNSSNSSTASTAGSDGGNKFNNKNILTGSMQHDIVTKLGPQHQQKILLLAGPPGSGKTTMINVILNMLGYRKVEINASDDRSFDAVSERIINVLESNSVFDQGDNPDKQLTPNCLVLEEIDGAVSAGVGDDSSGPTSVIQVLTKIVQAAVQFDKDSVARMLQQENDDNDDGNGKKDKNDDDDDNDDNDNTKPKKHNDKGRDNKKGNTNPKKPTIQGKQLTRPIICTCNVLQANSLKPLLPYCKIVELPAIEKNVLMNRLDQVVSIENIAADQSFIKGLVELLGTDIRSCLHTLQFSSYQTNHSKVSDGNTMNDGGKENPYLTKALMVPPPVKTSTNQFIYQLLQQDPSSSKVENLLKRSKSTSSVLTSHDLTSLRIGQHDSPSSVQDLTQLILSMQDPNPTSTMSDFQSSSTQRHLLSIPYLRTKYKLTPPTPLPCIASTLNKKSGVNQSDHEAQLALKSSTGINLVASNVQNNPQAMLLDQKIAKFTIRQRVNLYHLLNSNIDTLCGLLCDYDSVPKVMDQVYYLHPLYTGYTPDIGKTSLCSELCSLYESSSARNGIGSAALANGTSIVGEALSCLPMLLSYHVNAFVNTSATSMSAPTQGSRKQQQQQQQGVSHIVANNKSGGYLPMSIFDQHNDPAIAARMMYSNPKSVAHYYTTKHWDSLQLSQTIGVFMEQHYLPFLKQFLPRKQLVMHFLPFIYDNLVYLPAISNYPVLAYPLSTDGVNNGSNDCHHNDDDDVDDVDDDVDDGESINNLNVVNKPSRTTPNTTTLGGLVMTTSQQVVRSSTWHNVKNTEREISHMQTQVIPLMTKLRIKYEPTSIYIQNFNTDNGHGSSGGRQAFSNGFLQKQQQLIPHLLSLVYYDFSTIIRSYRHHDTMFDPYGAFLNDEKQTNSKLLNFPTVSAFAANSRANCNNNNVLLALVRQSNRSFVNHSATGQSPYKQSKQFLSTSSKKNLISTTCILIGDMYHAAQQTAQQFVQFNSSNLPWWQQQQQQHQQQLPFGFVGNLKHSLTQEVNVAISVEEELQYQRQIQEQKEIAAKKRMEVLRKQQEEERKKRLVQVEKLKEERHLAGKDISNDDNFMHDNDIDYDAQLLLEAENAEQHGNNNSAEFDARDLVEIQRKKALEQQDQIDDEATRAYVRDLDNQYANMTSSTITKEELEKRELQGLVKKDKGKNKSLLAMFGGNTTAPSTVTSPTLSMQPTPAHDTKTGSIPVGPDDMAEQPTEAPKRGNVAASRANHTLQLHFFDGFSNAVKRPVDMSFFLE